MIVLQVRARYPWAVLPTKSKINVDPAKEGAAMYAEHFRWMRSDRVPELCWPYRLGHEIGWTIPSPVDIRMDRIEDVELAADAEGVESFAAAAGYTSLWRRGKNHIAVRNAGWIRQAEVRTNRGWEAMFVPNGGGSLEWHLGWDLEIPAGCFLLVFGMDDLPELQVPIGVMDSKALGRLRQTSGMAIAVRPRGPVTIRRGQPVARMVLLHADSIKMQMHVQEEDQG